MALPPPAPVGGTIYKILLLINGVNAGASEEYYYATNTTSFDAIFNGLTQFFLTRQACLNYNSTSLVGVRISVNGSPRQTKLYTYNQIVKSTETVNPPEFPSLGWLVRAFEPSGFYKRSFTLKFFDQVDDSYGSGGTGLSAISPVPPPGFLGVYQGWAASLIAGGGSGGSTLTQGQFCIRGLAPLLPFGISYNVSVVAVNAATSSYVLSVPGVGAPNVGDLITVAGFRGSVIRGLNGPGRVISVGGAAPLFTVVTTRQPQQPGVPVITKYGQILDRPYAFYAISSLQIERLVTHKTGRPFFVTPGRRLQR